MGNTWITDLENSGVTHLTNLEPKGRGSGLELFKRDALKFLNKNL